MGEAARLLPHTRRGGCKHDTKTASQEPNPLLRLAEPGHELPSVHDIILSVYRDDSLDLFCHSACKPAWTLKKKKDNFAQLCQ